MLLLDEARSEELPAIAVAAKAWPAIGDALLRALDESPIGTAIAGPDGRWIRVNRAFAEIVGYAPEELVGRAFEDVTHPMDVDFDRNQVAKLDRGELHAYERFKRYLRKDGSIVFVHLVVSVARDAGGKVLCRLAQVKDVTERMRADEALRRSESNFRRLFDQASDGILISDSDGRFRDANAAACQMLRTSRDAIVGKTPEDFVPMEQIPAIIEEREQLLDNNRSAVVREMTFRRCDGALVPIELSSKFLLDGRQVAFMRDISERKRADREREDSLRWVHTVLEQSPVGLILVRGPGCKHLEVNSRLQEMIGGPVESFDQLSGVLLAANGAPIEHDDCVCVQAMSGDIPAPRERLLRHRDGGLIPVITSAAPIVDAGGTVCGVVLAVQDISAAKELERLRAEWASVVAHDLRQPLGAISLNAQVLARATEDERLRVRVERIRSAAQRLQRMVDDLMDLSRLDARRLELVRQSVDLPALVRASVERMSLEAPDRSFDVRVDGEIPAADADPDRLAQVMENLLTNAVKYGTGGTPIVVAIEHAGTEIAVAVTNDGQELPAEDLSRLFQRFQRSASAKLHGIKGTGLGLYITRSLVEAHGGHIAAASTPPGRITFRFTIPPVRAAA
jgi:PAS domain S-box-containing protein